MCACSADSLQRIASACQLDSEHSWMTSSGLQAPESTIYSHRGGSCHCGCKTHTHRHTQSIQSGLMLTQVNIGFEEDVGCLSGLNATCHQCSNGKKGRHTKLPNTSTGLNGNVLMRRKHLMANLAYVHPCKYSINYGRENA